MKYSIDRIEEKNIILENIETKEKKTIKKGNNTKDYKEGMILIEKEGILIPSKKIERKRRTTIKNKLKAVKK